jgi:hypothetical protein
MSFHNRKPGPGRKSPRGRYQGGRKGGQGRRPPSRQSQSQLESQLRQRAQAIQRRSGIPLEDALEIAARGMSIDLRKLLPTGKDGRIDEIAAQFKLTRSVAGNVISGNVSLDKAILRNQLKKNLEADRHRSCLEDAMESDEEITIHLQGHKTMTGRVVEIGAYTFSFRKTPKTRRKTKAMDYLKLHVLFAYPPMFADFVVKSHSVDEDLKNQKNKVPKRIVDRRMVKNEKLQRYLMNRAPLVLKTFDGDVFCGQLSWWGQYEMGLDLGNGVISIWETA